MRKAPGCNVSFTSMTAGRIALIAALVLIALGALGASWIKWRGFRASSSPSTIEVRVARSIRNFAIPSGERKRMNPFANDEVAPEQGRVHFLAQCAACHGVDGRGRTPIGANEYPRAPDLH